MIDLFKKKISKKWVALATLALGLFLKVKVALAIEPVTTLVVAGAVAAITWFTGKAIVSLTLYTIIGGLAAFLSWVVGAIQGVFTAILFQIMPYNDFINEDVVVKGWVMIRDLSNMFFILILLIIAFATILRIESYSWKKNLPKLLIMAVLINFSKTICGLAIDFGQVIMLTFANAFAAAGAANLYDAFGMKDLYTIRKAVDAVNMGDDPLKNNFGFAVTGSLVLGLIMLIVATITIATFVIILIFRIIMLWVLIILSPLAFLAMAIPAGTKYASQWMGEFTKYIVTGPVLAFFLWLALTMNSNQAPLNYQYKVNEKGGIESLGTGSVAGSPSNMKNFIVTTLFLVAGLSMAQQIGGIGSAMGMNAVGKAKSMGLGLAKKSAGWGGKKLGLLAEQKLEEHGMPYLTRGFWQGFGARGTRLQEEAKTRAAGKGQQLAEERLKPKFWEKREGVMDWAEIQRRAVINKKIGDLGKALGSTANPRQEMQHQAKLAFELEGIEGEQQREAIIEMATSKGNLDDVYFSMIPHFKRQIAEGKMKETDFAEKFGMSSKDAETYSVNKARRFVAGYLGIKKDWADAVEMPTAIENGAETDKEKWLEESRAKVKILLEQSDPKEQNKLRTMAAASEVAKEVGHWEQLTTVKDDMTGKYMMLPETDRQDEAIGEMKKQSVAKNLTNTATHPFRVTVYDEKSKEWTRSGSIDMQEGPEKEFWKRAFGGQHVNDIHRAQSRLGPHLVGQYYDKKGALISDDVEAIKRGFKGAADLKKSADEMRKSNKIIFDALYRLIVFGKGSATNPIPGDDNWKPIE